MAKVSIIVGRVPSVELTAEIDAQWKVFEQKYHEYISGFTGFLQDFVGDLVIMYDILDEVSVEVHTRTPFTRYVLRFFNCGQNRPFDFGVQKGYPLPFYQDLYRIFGAQSFLVSIFYEDKKRIDLHKVYLDDKTGLRWVSMEGIL